MCCLLVLCAISSLTAYEAKVEQSWNLKNGSNFFDINIGVGYDVGSDSSKLTSTRDATLTHNRKGYLSEVLDVALEGKKSSRQLDMPNYEQIQQPMLFRDLHNYDEVLNPHYTNSVVSPRPSMTELQKVVSDIGDESKYSKIVQVLKVPAIYEIHLQSNAAKTDEDHIVPKTNDLKLRNTTSNDYKNFYYPSVDKTKLNSVETFQPQQHKDDPEYVQKHEGENDFDFERYVKETTKNLQNKIHEQIFTSNPNVYHTEAPYGIFDNHNKDSKYTNEHIKFPEITKTPFPINNHFDVQNIASNSDSFENFEHLTSFAAKPDAGGKYPNFEPSLPSSYQNVASKMKYYPISKQFVRPSSSTNYTYNQYKNGKKTLNSRPITTQRQNPHSNSYSTLSSFVPYGHDSRKKRKPSKRGNTFQRDNSLGYKMFPLESTRFGPLQDKRILIDTIQLTTNKPEILQQPRSSYAQKKRDNELAYQFSSIPELRRFSRESTTYMPINFKIHIEEKTGYGYEDYER